MKKILVILAEGFEEIEAVGVIDVLRRLDFPVSIAGLAGNGPCKGAHGVVYGVDCAFAGCRTADFDAVFLPGGLPGATNLLASDAVRKFLQDMSGAGKVVSAICAAPIVLAAAGLLEKRTFTMYPGFDRYLNGLRPTGALAERDGNVVTGKGPGAVFAFSAKLAQALGVEEGKLNALWEGMFVHV